MEKTATRLIGGKVNNRNENDFYVTPKWAVEALLKHEQFSGTIWEPACGDGAISKVLTRHGYEVYSTDLHYRGYGEPANFFKSYQRCNNIITNPPYSLCNEFILKAKLSCDTKIAMLLKTIALEGRARHTKIWKDNDFPLARMYQFIDRLSFGKEDAGGMMAFAWFVWDRSHRGSPTIEWIRKESNPGGLFGSKNANG